MKMLIVSFWLSSAFAAVTAGAPETPFATATLVSRSGSKATGTVDFARTADGVIVRIDLKNVSPGAHGLHVHEKGDCTAKDASSAGDHFNPTGRHHGAPSAVDRHVGDFGNVDVGANGSVRAELRFANVQGFDWKDFVGRAVVLHDQADDLKSQPSGNAGKRIACGVVATTR